MRKHYYYYLDLNFLSCPVQPSYSFMVIVNGLFSYVKFQAEEKFSRIREAIKGQPYEGQVIRQYYAISSNSEMESEIEQV